VVDRLREHHAAILRTDLDGMITIRTDGHSMNVETHSGLLGQR
jgi:beta-lactamase superfamily II metal-dependent hydrolase